MKIFIIFISFFICTVSNATTYYISPLGNDALGNGSLLSPWKTLAKATSTVTGWGDVIHVTLGSYTETVKSNLAVGVSIEGEGILTVIKSTVSTQFEPIIALHSAEGTNGNQHISNLKLDGDNLTTSWAISIRGRSNVKVYNCTIVNFFETGVNWGGRNDGNLLPPTIFATGNEFHDNTVTNCATFDGVYGRGALQFGGQDGMLIYNNTIKETGRPTGTNGWPIKGCNDSWIKGCKIYNNYLERDPFPYNANGFNNYWDFAMELFDNLGGNEIYGNTVKGSIDINRQVKGSYAYSIYIHDNVIGHDAPSSMPEEGIIMEYSTDGAIIEKNTIKNTLNPIYFSLRTGSVLKDIVIRNNLAYNIGISNNSQQGQAVRIGANDNIYTSSNFSVYNNTFIALTGSNAPFWGIGLPAGSSSTNVSVRNNIVMNFAGAAISANPASSINTLSVENNLFNGNGNNNAPSWANGAPANNTTQNNISGNPLFLPGLNFLLQLLSPAVDAGIYVGIPFNNSAPDIGYSETGLFATNLPPTANAGTDQNITLPTNSVSLTGSGTDPDGTITAYAWVKIAGPTAGTIATPGTANSNVTGLVAGTYQFQLTVTDNGGATAKDTMQVIVSAAANIAPTANAGADQAITLPTNSVSLTGSGTDPDGTITAYAWVKIAGPTAGTIATPATANSNVTGLVAGTYKFQLTVTDNSGATAKDTMQVIVNPAANIAPTANAGADQTITLPTNSVSLTGSGTDPDGTITAYAWAKIAGPTAGTIATPATANSNVTGLVAGTYQFQLTVTDNSGATAKDTMQVIVNAAVPPANIAPTANAGADQTITLPTNSVSLTGSGTDPDGTITAYAWAKIAGPTAGTIATPGTANSNVTGLVAGTYQFQLTVTDNSGATAKDTMQVVVNAAAPPANIAPTANAGADQAITLPTNSVSLTGSGTDPDGTITAYAWAKIAGPTAGTIVTPGTANSNVTGLVAGTYQFQLTVTDNSGATAKDTMQVIVNAAVPPANIAPTANAGADQAITLPTNSVSLTGSGTDPDGTITAYAWAKIAGPTAGTIVTPGTANSNVTGLVAGTYQFQLTVTDNSGATAKDTMQVIVNAAVPPANIAPTANAGADQAITLPTNSVSLTGSGTDPDGTITAYAWAKIAGPTAGTIVTPGTANSNVTGLVAGTYQFQLTVTDNSGATAKDTMQVIVNPAANIAPTANAGADQTITLPTNSVSLTGSGTDPDGTIVAYAWTKIAGPTAGVITTPGVANSTVTGLVAGTYQFELKVTDNSGASASDVVQVIVNPAANVPPTANAGNDQNVTLPINSINLTGSGIDPDGTITAYAWTKIAGPAAGIITTPGAANSTVTGLVAGTYQFQLTVTDNSGATATDVMQVIVTPANVPPTANAGNDQVITLPTNSVTLIGSGIDTDGTITGYSWTKIAGPTAGTIATPGTANSNVTGLAAGTYQFQLRVTDNNGATATDVVQVIVNIPPVSSAGSDQNITSPVSTVTVTGIGTDADGTVTAYHWTKIAGPVAGGSITNAASPSSSITGLVAGIYKFEFKVTDNHGAIDTDTLQVIVFAPNVPPVAHAGLDQSITLPTNSANLAGSGTDTDGFIAAYKWTKISGPAAGTITNATTAATTVTGLTAGTYQFELRVTDNNGATATDVMQVTVNPANIPPVANAGIDQLITLPSGQVALNGSGTDIDGTVVAYAWKQISGPPDKLTSLNTPAPVLQNLVAGVYKFELTVTDDKGATDKDTVGIIAETLVVPAANTLKVYPNPVIDFATVEIDATTINSTLLMVVTDVQGKVVYKKQLPGTNYTSREKINMSAFGKGTYFITIYFNGKDKLTAKAVKL